MNPPIDVFNDRKLVSRAIRRRLAVALGAAAVIGSSAMAVASPAMADQYVQYCQTYHSWTECISFDPNNGNLAVNALNNSTVGNHSMWLTNYPGGTHSQVVYFSAGNWVGFPVHQTPGSQVCAGIDTTTILCRTGF
jgi:hypothetical protein